METELGNHIRLQQNLHNILFDKNILPQNT